MKLLLDTHAVIWWLIEKDRLSKRAYAAIELESSEVYVSVASAWEMAIKAGLGKWPEALPLIEAFEASMATANFRLLPITVAHARTSGLMQHPHRDPFDRLLVAQAMFEGLTLVTSDTKVQGMGAPCLW